MNQRAGQAGGWLGLLLAAGVLCAPAAEPTPAIISPTTNAPVAAPVATNDAMASAYMMKCAGCHAVTGPKLVGPNMAPVAAWKRADVLLNIKRMEKNVGPLTETEVNAYADFLQSPTLEPRVQAERERLAKLLLAKMAPPSAAEGGRLFRGETPLRNGGPACLACHTVRDNSDRLGPRLGDSLAKMGDMAFYSFVENANSAVMNPIYKPHPVTKQEALHLAAFIKQPGAEATDIAVGLYGTLGAALFLGGMALFARGRKESTRLRLIREATRSRDP